MNIYEKLSYVQANLDAPKRQYNSFGRYYYRSCEDILEALKEPLNVVNASVVFTDDVVQVGDRYYIRSTIDFVDNDEQDSKISSHAFAREPANKKGMDESQITGSTSSYCRKYALQAMFLIDDQKDADTNEFKNQQSDVAPMPSDVSLIDPLEEKGEELKNLINNAAKEKKITKRAALEILQKHGADSPKEITSIKQYEEIKKEIEEAIK